MMIIRTALLILLAVICHLSASETPFATFTLPDSRHVQGPVLLPDMLRDRMILVAEMNRDDPGREVYRRLGAIGGSHSSLICLANLRLNAHMSEAYGFHQSAGLARGSRVSLYQNASIPGPRPSELPWLWVVASNGSVAWSGPANRAWPIIEGMLATPQGIIPVDRLWQHSASAVTEINGEGPLGPILNNLRTQAERDDDAAKEANEILKIITAWRDSLLADAAGERRLSEPGAVEENLDTGIRRLAGDPLSDNLTHARRNFASDRDVRQAKRIEADLERIINVATEHQLSSAKPDDPNNAQGRTQLARALEQFLNRHRDHPIGRRAEALRQEWGL